MLALAPSLLAPSPPLARPRSRFSPAPEARFAVELHETPAGIVQQPALSDHHVSVHLGAPVRMSRHHGRVRSLRVRGEIALTPGGAQ